MSSGGSSWEPMVTMAPPRSNINTILHRYNRSCACVAAEIEVVLRYLVVSSTPSLPSLFSSYFYFNFTKNGQAGLEPLIKRRYPSSMNQHTTYHLVSIMWKNLYIYICNKYLAPPKYFVKIRHWQCRWDVLHPHMSISTNHPVGQNTPWQSTTQTLTGKR